MFIENNQALSTAKKELKNNINSNVQILDIEEIIEPKIIHISQEEIKNLNIDDSQPSKINKTLEKSNSLNIMQQRSSLNINNNYEDLNENNIGKLPKSKTVSKNEAFKNSNILSNFPNLHGPLETVIETSEISNSKIESKKNLK
jgi:hypothetical protein